MSESEEKSKADEKPSETKAEPDKSPLKNSLSPWLNWLPLAVLIWAVATVLLRIASDSSWWLCALGGIGAVLLISPGPAPPRGPRKRTPKKGDDQAGKPASGTTP